MGDTIDDFRALKQYRQERRRIHGVPCPVCQDRLPRAHAKILLPGQLCRAHKPHYRDPREDTDETYDVSPATLSEAEAKGEGLSDG